MSNASAASTSLPDRPELSPLKRAFLTIEELQGRLAAGERAKREPIAIVGIGCRLPGGADSPAALWQLLREGVDAIGEVPRERWDIDAYYDPDPDAPGKISTRHGGFVRGVDGFDPQFFGIAPREAASMDPQQRLLLEVTWEALENAGIAPAGLAGSRTGVFVGINTGDYAQLIMDARGVDGLDAYYASGIAHSVASGRISYVLGLQGPSISLDTACSSSLVAIHLAVQSLRHGESKLALAGGVNLMLSPENSITLSKYQMLAPDGRCKFGDAGADGFVRAEGCGIVVLKRLSDALADGDPVLAVIRGTALNQDGASSGLTAPNGPSQEAVIRAALANGGLKPGDVSYIEAHGTGTALGDPIEVQALGEVFGPGRPSEQPLLVGSVKTNLGHLEAAAGVAGLIKLALMLEHGEIPASLHFTTPSPHIAWDELPLRVPTAPAPWLTPAGRRLGGLSSFGFSGTNVHVILEQAPALPATPDTVERPLHLLALSAADHSALRELAGSYAGRLRSAPSLADVAYTAGSGRSHFAHRLAVVAADSQSAAESLAAFAAGEDAAGLLYQHVQRVDPPKIGFLFTGQGAQYAGMGRELYAAQPVFRAALDRCAAILANDLDRPLLEIMFAEPGTADAALLDQTAYTQPALVALEYALAELWRSWGVTPGAVLGHSVGEYTAAIIAGVMSLEDGLALVAARGRLMGSLPAGGAMAAVFSAPEQVEAAIRAHDGNVGIAAYNGPEHTVIAGPAEAVQALVEQLTAAGVRAQRLNVSHAFHSALLDPMLPALEQAAGRVQLSPPRLRLVSNLTGAPIGAELTQPSYWRRHARETVRYAQGVEQLARLGCEVLIEIGPHPTLLGMAKAVLPPETSTGLPSLRKGRDDWQQLLESLARVYTLGVPVDWVAFDRPYGRRKLALPTYPFQRERYWVTPLKRAARASRPAADAHPLLGRRLRSALKQIQFEQTLGRGELAFLDEHRVFGTTILPAAGFVELALAAAQAGLHAELPALDDLLIHAPLALGDDLTRTLQTVLSPSGDGATVEVFSQADGDEQWQLHSSAAVREGRAGDRPVGDESLAEMRARCSEEIDAAEHYGVLRAHSLDLGESLQSLRRIWRGRDEAVGELALSEPEAASAHSYVLHPALLDACLQLLAVAATDADGTYLPIAVDRLQVYAPTGTRAVAYARLLPPAGADGSRATLSGTIRLFDETGALLAELDGLRLKRAEQLAMPASEQDSWLYEVAWRPTPAEVAPLAADFLARPEAMAAAADERIGALEAELRLDRYSTQIGQLEALATDYIVQALNRLGWRPIPGERVDVARLADRLGVIAAQRELFARLLSILAEDGVLVPMEEGWQVARVPAAAPTEGRADALIERYPLARGDIETVRRCGDGLADALRGTVDPLQLLFPGGSTASAEQLYRESPLSQAYTRLLAEAAATAVAGLPAGRTLRVLEVGGGTGGATSAVLPGLDAARTSYTFSDISPMFLARARETFAAYPFVEYRALDIELDPLAQGFEEHGYDLLIASNVVHATADLRRTFGNLTRLLAPGGAVLLLEMTAPLRWIDISFGLTEGWWKFSDRELRPAYPLLGRDAWLSFLEQLGLQEPRAVPGAGKPDAGLEHQHILAARVPAEMPTALPPQLHNLLIFADAHGTGERLAGLVHAAGGRAALVTRGTGFVRLDNNRFQLNPDSDDELARLLGERLDGAQTGWDGVVYLWPLDAASLAQADGSPVARQQALLGDALQLARALVLDGTGARLWLVTRGAQPAGDTTADPQQATLWGFNRSLALEHPELRSVLLDLDPASEDPASGLLAELRRGDEPEVALRGEQRLVARLARTTVGTTEQPDTEEAAVELLITERGALDNLVLQPAARRAPGPGEVEIRVAATALNFKDVLNVLGMYPGDPGQPGSECAGTIVAVGPGVDDLGPGDEVVALASGSFRSYCTVAAEFVARRPAGLSAAEAITIPIAYLTAAFALQHLGNMQAGERVLIHAAAGGVGLAAVRLAQRAGVEVFATAGSPAKREYLRSLGVRYIFDSRSLAFADEVRAATGGEGVDLVLNSLAGEFVPRSLGLLRAGGRFLELGKRDHLTAAQAGELGRGISYHVIDWGDNAREQPELIRGMLLEIMDRAGRGELPALPFSSFPLAEAPAAFRFMAQARHIGKVVVTQRDVEAATIRSDASYLITGGLGGLGLLTGRWLVERGARHLALMGRGGAGAEALATIAELEQAGAQVLAITGDVSREGDVAAALQRIAAELPPLRGIIHSAGVLDDGAVTQQSWPRFQKVLAPKVDGAWNLHSMTAGSQLDFFVLYSSAAALLGSPGQTNHAAANSFMDALAHLRRAEGLPGLSINWGAWSEVGAAVTTGAVDRIGKEGVGEIAPAQGLELLARMLESAPPQVGVVPVDWPVFVRRFAGAAPAFFSEIVAPELPAEPAQAAAQAAPDLGQRLAEAAPQRRIAMLRDYTRDATGHVLGLPPARVDDFTPLSALGLDSLMAVELRNLLGAGLSLPRRLPATLVFDYPTVAAIADYLAAELFADQGVAQDEPELPSVPADGAAVGSMIDALEDLSDDEIDRLLAEKLLKQ